MVFILIILNVILILTNIYLIREVMTFNNLENKILKGIWDDDDEKN